MAILGRKIEVGCDIGAHSIKWAECVRKGDKYQLISFYEKPLPHNAVVDGKIRDFAAVAKNLKEIFKKAKKIHDISIAVQGAGVITKKIKLPNLSPKEAHACTLWEAEQYLPFEKEEAYLDYMRVGDSHALIVGAEKGLVDTYTQFLTDLKSTVSSVETPSLALERIWKANYAEDFDKNVGIISLGAHHSCMTVFHNRTLHWSYPVFINGDSLTKKIQKKLKLTFEEAENLKQGSQEKAPIEISPLVEDFLDELGDQVLRTIKVFLSKEPSISLDKIYVTGGVSKTQNLKTRLAEKLGFPILPLEPFKKILHHKKRIAKETLNKIESQAATALGLAIK